MFHFCSWHLLFHYRLLFSGRVCGSLRRHCPLLLKGSSEMRQVVLNAVVLTNFVDPDIDPSKLIGMSKLKLNMIRAL